MRRCLLVIFLFLSSAHASSFNAGLGLLYLGLGVEGEVSIDNHHSLLVGVGGLPLPGAEFMKLASGGDLFQNFATTSAYVGYRYVFYPENSSFFLAGRFGFLILDLGLAGGFGGYGPVATAGYRLNTGDYKFIDVEVGAAPLFGDGRTLQALLPILNLNFGFRF